MKKTALVFTMFCFCSLFAAANHSSTDPGNPPGTQQKQPSFTLSTGYFSFFGLLSNPVMVSDTTAKTVLPAEPTTISKKNMRSKL